MKHFVKRPTHGETMYGSHVIAGIDRYLAAPALVVLFFVSTGQAIVVFLAVFQSSFALVHRRFHLSRVAWARIAALHARFRDAEAAKALVSLFLQTSL